MSVDTKEYYDGDELVPVSGSKKFRRSKLFIGLSMIGLSVTGLTLAASISINAGNIEFGQGLYKIQSCDQWIAINLVPTEASYDGLSRVAEIQISGLDSTRCRGSNFKIQLFPAGGSTTPMALFAEGSTPVDRLLLSVSPDDFPSEYKVVPAFNYQGAKYHRNNCKHKKLYGRIFIKCVGKNTNRN